MRLDFPGRLLQNGISGRNSAVRWVKRACVLGIFFWILGFGAADPHLAWAQTGSRVDIGSKRVLVLHAHEAGSPVFTGTDRGLSAALLAGGVPLLNQIYESLELRRYPFPEHRRLLVEQMRLRYSGREPDAIVTMYPEALEFVLQDCAGIFPGIPILALSLPQGYRLPETDRLIVGHSALFDIAGTFEVARNLVPSAKRVYVVSGAHAVDRRIEDQARHDLQKWESELDFRYLGSLPFEEILRHLSDAPPDAIVLLLIFSQDVAGKSHTAQNLALQLSQASKAPLFGLLDASLGYGIVGGMLISFERTGAKAGEMVLTMLKGEDRDQSTTKVLNVPPAPMFDWRQLKHWNLSVDALAAGTIVQNRQFSFWELYRWHVVVGLGVLVLQGALIAGLLIERRQRTIAEQGLRQSERRMRLVTNALPVLISYVDSDQRYRFNNRAYVDWFGVSPEDAAGRTVRDVVGDAYYQRTAPYIARALSGEHVSYAQEAQMPDGRSVFFEAVYAPDMTEFGEVRGFYALAMDVTERNAARQESRRLQDELLHASRITTTGELAGTLAHEINQPLAAIMSNAQAARRFLDSPTPDLDEVREILQDIVAEDARAGEVINRLRAFLKKAKTELEPVDLNAVFGEVAGFVRSDAVVRDATLSLELDPALPKVIGDRIQLQQVALNLVLNAFDAVDAQPRGERRVLLRTGRQEGQVHAAVTDSGKGIPAEEFETVFKPFFTTKPRGLGLGLSISRSIIARHQGRIWAESLPDGGACFRLCLPAAPETDTFGGP